MATIREIAELAGVSLGTVDRVLHERGRVAPATATRVRKVIKDLGFTPNIFARNLSTSKSYTFGVLMPRPDQDSGYWNLPFRGMEAAVQSSRAYQISLRPEWFDRYKPESFLSAHRTLVESGVDGILMAAVIPQAAALALRDPKLCPHICFDTGFVHPRVLCRIGQDSVRSGRLAGRLMGLLCHGGGTIAMFKPDTDSAHITGRIQGASAMLQGSAHAMVTRVLSHQADREHYLSVVQGTLAEVPDLAGILVTDATTHLVARALDELGKGRLPLIGYDLLEEDVPCLEAGLINFLITQNPVGQGELAVKTMVERVVLRQSGLEDIPVPINVVSLENYRDFLAGPADPALHR